MQHRRRALAITEREQVVAVPETRELRDGGERVSRQRNEVGGVRLETLGRDLPGGLGGVIQVGELAPTRSGGLGLAHASQQDEPEQLPPRIAEPTRRLPECP